MQADPNGPRQFFFGDASTGRVSAEDAAREAEEAEDDEESPTPVRAVKPAPARAAAPAKDLTDVDIVALAKKRLEKIDVALAGMADLVKQRGQLARLIAAAEADSGEQLA